MHKKGDILPEQGLLWSWLTAEAMASHHILVHPVELPSLWRQSNPGSALKLVLLCLLENLLSSLHQPEQEKLKLLRAAK